MTEETQGSPSPSEVGFTLFGRRRFIVGAAGSGRRCCRDSRHADPTRATRLATEAPAG